MTFSCVECADCIGNSLCFVSIHITVAEYGHSVTSQDACNVQMSCAITDRTYRLNSSCRASIAESAHTHAARYAPGKSSRFHVARELHRTSLASCVNSESRPSAINSAPSYKTITASDIGIGLKHSRHFLESPGGTTHARAGSARILAGPAIIDRTSKVPRTSC